MNIQTTKRKKSKLRKKSKSKKKTKSKKKIIKGGEIQIKIIDLNRFIIIPTIYEKSYLYFLDKKYNNIYEIDKKYDITLMYEKNIDIYYVINTKNIKTKIEIDDKLINLLSKKYTSNIHKRVILKKNKYGFYSIYESIGYGLINLKTASKQIKNLNIILNRKCPNLAIGFNYKFNIPFVCVSFSGFKGSKIILYLYDKNKKQCLSTIEFYPEKQIDKKVSISISSETNPNYTRRKYNSLLRAVSFLLCTSLTPFNKKISYIISDPINPISVWSLVSKFEHKIQIIDDNLLNLNDLKKLNLNDVKIDNNTLSLSENTNVLHTQIFKKLYDENHNCKLFIIIYLPITFKNLETAGSIINKLLDKKSKLIC